MAANTAAISLASFGTSYLCGDEAAEVQQHSKSVMHECVGVARIICSAVLHVSANKQHPVCTRVRQAGESLQDMHCVFGVASCGQC
jgi:hypothetical protein